VTALPTGREAKVSRIVTYDGDLEEAVAPMSVTLTLDRELDLSRGGMIVSGSIPASGRRWQTQMVALQPSGIETGREYILKQTTQRVSARVTQGSLPMNGIGPIQIETTIPLFADPYTENRHTGSFILIDRASNNTVAAGMIDHAGAPGRRMSAAKRAAFWLRRAAHALEQFSDGGGI